MYPAALRWIETLPWRWALGGVGLCIAWILVVMAAGLILTEASPAALFGRALAPFAAIGFAWGWLERRKWRRAVDCHRVLQRLDAEFPFVQAGKGAVAGLAFGASISVVDVITGPAQGIVHHLAIPNSASGLGAVAGLGIGIVARANLRRRLRPEPVVEPTDAAR